MKEINKIRFYRTGQLVRDIGIVSLYEYLKAIDKNDLDLKLTDNYLEFNRFDIERLIKYMKSKDITSFPYIQNSKKFGNVNGPKDDRMYENLKDIIKLAFEINRKSVEEQESILMDYEPSGQCTICNTYKATKKHYSVKDNNLVERIGDKTLYTFLGSQSNTFNNYCMTYINICFVCELLSLFFLLYIDKFKLDMIAYCERLKDLYYINHRIMIRQKLYSSNAIYINLANLNTKSIRVYDIERHPKKGLLLKYNNSFDVSSLIKKLKLINIIEQFRFNEKNKNELKAYIKILIFNDNYTAVEQILIFNLLSNDLGNVKKYNLTKLNIELYNEFLEGGFEVKNASSFSKIGGKLARKVDEDKKKNVSFRLTQLLKSDSREQLFNELLHLLISYEIEIPENFSYGILKADSIQLHYNIGKFLEYFNKKGGEE